MNEWWSVSMDTFVCAFSIECVSDSDLGVQQWRTIGRGIRWSDNLVAEHRRIGV